MRLRLFTLVYGEKYLNWFEKVSFTVGSLGAIWDIHTDQKSSDRAGQMASRFNKPELHIRDRASSGEELQRALIEQLEICLNTDSALLICPPDSIFGKGSIQNITAIASGENGLCVSVPHVRVNSDFLDSFNEPLTNPELVKKSFQHLHKTWADADITTKENNIWWSGTALRRLGNGLYAVTHRIPTPYLVRPLPKDLDYFRGQEKLGAWDHRWPEILVQDQRQRVIGSSDGAFIAELTEKGINHPPLKMADSSPDRYRGNMIHHAVNRNTVSIWRE